MLEITVKKFKVINKNFLTTNDIAILMDCSKSKANKYRYEYLKRQKYESDYFKPQINLKDFAKFYKIDLDNIRENYLILRSEQYERAT